MKKEIVILSGEYAKRLQRIRLRAGLSPVLVCHRCSQTLVIDNPVHVIRPRRIESGSFKIYHENCWRDCFVESF